MGLNLDFYFIPKDRIVDILFELQKLHQVEIITNRLESEVNANEEFSRIRDYFLCMTNIYSELSLIKKIRLMLDERKFSKNPLVNQFYKSDEKGRLMENKMRKMLKRFPHFGYSGSIGNQGNYDLFYSYLQYNEMFSYFIMDRSLCFTFKTDNIEIQQRVVKINQQLCNYSKDAVCLVDLR